MFIGGLIKHTSNLNQNGIPFLRRVPGLRRFVSNEESTEINSETIVLITPHVVDSFDESWNQAPVEKVDGAEQDVEAEIELLEFDLARFDDRRQPAP